MMDERNSHLKRLFSRQEILTLPNLLSLFRLILIPVFLFLYVGRADYSGALAVLALSALSDILDGRIARHYNMVSDFGKILDPLADKLTQAALLVSLAFRYRGMFLLMGIFLVKEICMTVWGWQVLRRDNRVNGALWYGKANTVVFTGVMAALIVFPHIPEPLANVLMGICGVVMGLALFLYGRFYRKILKK